jgi:hypothetical protein
MHKEENQNEETGVQSLFNPYLPSFEYVPDSEPRVFGGRLYVYGSHDAFDGSVYCPNDYVCWSAPVDDLGNWRYEGVIYRKADDETNKDGKHDMYAPDVAQGPDGRYYLYYALDFGGVMSVAVCDTPAGRYNYYGVVHKADGYVIGSVAGDIRQFDPGIFIDDDGRIYLYSGFGMKDGPEWDEKFGHRKYDGAYCMELEPDMLTVKSEVKKILPKIGYAGGTSFEGHEFFEASSMRKIDGKYYFVYSTMKGHDLCYAISDRPDGGFVYGGVIISNGDVGIGGRSMRESVNYMGNNHGGLAEINGQWYIFYHRHTNKTQFSRQGCAEKIFFDENGHIPQVEMTSCGLHDGSLCGKGRYEAYIACNLFFGGSAGYYFNKDNRYDEHPYLTQTGADREDNPDQYIANMRDGATAGFKYFQFEDTRRISVEVKGGCDGSMEVTDAPQGGIIAEIPVKPGDEYQEFSAKMKPVTGKTALYFTYRGKGAADFRAFTLK